MSWNILLPYQKDSNTYFIESSGLDVSEEELFLCIAEQVYGDLKWISIRNIALIDDKLTPLFPVESSLNRILGEIFKMARKQEKPNWIAVRNYEVIKIFKDRKEAVKYFKELLKQTLKDFDKQDTSDEYDYQIIIPQIEFYPIKEREAYLSLLWKSPF